MIMNLELIEKALCKLRQQLTSAFSTDVASDVLYRYCATSMGKQQEQLLFFQKILFICEKKGRA